LRENWWIWKNLPASKKIKQKIKQKKTKQIWISRFVKVDKLRPINVKIDPSYGVPGWNIWTTIMGLCWKRALQFVNLNWRCFFVVIFFFRFVPNLKKKRKKSAKKATKKNKMIAKGVKMQSWVPHNKNNPY